MSRTGIGIGIGQGKRSPWGSGRCEDLWSRDLVYWKMWDKLLLSIPFTWNLPKARELIRQYGKKKRDVLIGGPAVYNYPDYLEGMATIGFPEDIEPISPLALHNPLATFTSRGCINKCFFCAVPKIEGSLKEIRNFVPRPLVCDNNILACSRKHFDRVIDKCKKLPFVDFNQGLEAKLLDRHHAERFTELRHIIPRLAFDKVEDEKYVIDAIKTLNRKGIKNIRCHVLVGCRDTPEDAKYRLDKMSVFGIMAYPMRYQPLSGKKSLARNLYLDENWTEEELKRIVSYYRAKGSILNKVNFEDFYLDSLDGKEYTGFGL